MARYILIDYASGYIWGDSADLEGKIFNGDPVEFARALDESLGAHGREYALTRHQPQSVDIGYHVYRADIDGSEAVPVVHDGQSQEEIDAVTTLCAYEGFIRISETF